VVLLGMLIEHFEVEEGKKGRMNQSIMGIIESNKTCRLFKRGDVQVPVKSES